MSIDIWNAIEHEQLDQIALFSDSGGNLDLLSRENKSLLTFAIENGCRSSFERLLELGADPNRFDRRGLAPIFVAARQKDTFWLEKCLEHGGDKDRDNHKSPQKRNRVVLSAIRSGSLECVRLLIEKGADIETAIDADSGVYDTPLVESANVCQFGITLLLLESGADFRKPAPGGFSFAYVISVKRPEIYRDQESAEVKTLIAVREWLKAHGADPDKVQKVGDTYRFAEE